MGADGLISFLVNDAPVSVTDDGAPLSEVLRDRLGLHSVKDGCSPQGQCGCCTVLVDGQPRVSCVTPSRRVAGRSVCTVEGLETAPQWAQALTATGGSQCGFCTPGIMMRLAARAGTTTLDAAAVREALKAHLCRCTGWQTIVEAAVAMPMIGRSPNVERDFVAAAQRAEIEGGRPQRVGPEVALGSVPFADDTAPVDALVAVRDADGEWRVGESVGQARAAAGKVQGRRTTIAATPPIPIPSGDWVRTLQTSWVEPGYLETDASWCEPGGEPVTPLANGGAFGAKSDSEVGAVARRLADVHQRSVRVLYSREDTVRLGPKRPPLAAGIAADGSGVIVVAATPGIAAAVAAVAPSIEVREVEVAGPPTSTAIRGAGWVEAAVLLASLAETDTVRAPNGALATAAIVDGAISVTVRCGEPLDAIVLRSYCIGAAHMAWSWVRSEAIAVDDAGIVHDLTIRSFGIVRAVDMPHVEVIVEPDAGPAVNGSDAVFAAVAAATWRAAGHVPVWPSN